MRTFRKLVPSPSMLVALAALIVATSGVAYAAVTLADNSVRSRHIVNGTIKNVDLRNNSVDSAKVRDASLQATDLSAAAQAALKGNTGPAGPAGPTGPAGPLLDTLPSGKTLKGVFSFASRKVTAGGYIFTQGISYQFPLAAAPAVNIIQLAGAPTAACPGTVTNPLALPGNLCVYVGRDDGPSGLGVSNTSSMGGGRFGPQIFPSNVAADTNYEIDGTWAVTAP